MVVKQKLLYDHLKSGVWCDRWKKFIGQLFDINNKFKVSKYFDGYTSQIFIVNISILLFICNKNNKKFYTKKRII